MPEEAPNCAVECLVDNPRDADPPSFGANVVLQIDNATFLTHGACEATNVHKACDLGNVYP